MAKQVFSEEDKWLRANTAEGHIYSAYLDMRPEIILRYSHSRSKITWGEIFIIALLPTKTRSRHVNCVLKYQTTERAPLLKIIPAEVKLLNENWDLKYSAFFVICDLAHSTHVNYEEFYNVKQLPESVGLKWSSTSAEMQFVDIHYPKFGVNQFYKEPENFMAVCVPGGFPLDSIYIYFSTSYLITKKFTYW